MNARMLETGENMRLLSRLDAAYAETDRIFALLKPEDFYARPIPHRHRLLFYLGHLEAFDTNLFDTGLLASRFPAGKAEDEFRSAGLDRLFAFGIDPGADNLPSEPASAWPEVTVIRRYAAARRASLRERLAKALAAAPGTREDSSASDDAPDSLGQLVNVAIEHRLMHAETLAYLLNFLPGTRPGPVQLAAGTRALTDAATVSAPRWVGIPQGVATLGRERDEGFGWDNEFGVRVDRVPEFAIDRCMVSNGEYLRFVREQGYSHRAFWTEADWQWKSALQGEHPAFWQRVADSWYYRSPQGLIPLPLDWPVYVSHAEASAYARWRGAALPSEAQWHRAAYGTTEGFERDYPWGSDQPRPSHGNFDFRSWVPAAVDAHPRGASAFGVLGLLGNGWEWTRDTFAALPGFAAFPFYPGYSADFFDGNHFVMKGGSPRTAACMLRRSFRNWFQPHYPYVYAGFRCVQT